MVSLSTFPTIMLEEGLFEANLPAQTSPLCRACFTNGDCNLRPDSGFDLVKNHTHRGPQEVLEKLEEKIRKMKKLLTVKQDVNFLHSV